MTTEQPVLRDTKPMAMMTRKLKALTKSSLEFNFQEERKEELIE